MLQFTMRSGVLPSLNRRIRCRLLVLAVLCMRSVLDADAAVIWMVPQAKYIEIWSEWRNHNCRLGSVWRPVLDDIDIGDGKLRPPILLGDIFLANAGPPNFPTTLLVFDEQLDSCATAPGQTSYPCMEATEATGEGMQVPFLFAKTEWPLNGTLWTARLGQCVCANQVHVGDGVYKCQENEQGSNQPTLTLREDGYAREQAQFQLKAPLCPANYHVMGHVGTLVGRDVPDNYKCIHKQLLRSSE